MNCIGSFVEIAIILSVVSSFSIVINLIIILICILGKVLDDLTSNIIVCMAVNDFARSIALIITIMIENDNSSICKAIGFISCFTMMSNLVLATIISYTLYQVIIKDISTFIFKKKIWFAISYPVLAIFQALPFITDSYGFDGILCTLKNNTTSNTWLFFGYYVPCWAISAYILFVYFRLYFRLKQKKQSNAAIDLIINRGYIYPLILVFLVMLLTIHRILQTIGNRCILQKFRMSVEYMLASHGLLNGIAFFCNPNVRRVLKEKYNYKFRSNTGSSLDGDLILNLRDYNKTIA